MAYIRGTDVEVRLDLSQADYGCYLPSSNTLYLWHLESCTVFCGLSLEERLTVRDLIFQENGFFCDPDANFYYTFGTSPKIELPEVESQRRLL